MSETAQQPPKVWREEELQALPEDGYIHEVVNGELVMSPKNNFEHGDICSPLFTALSQFARSRRLGVEETVAVISLKKNLPFGSAIRVPREIHDP
jgi:Uma2 family endonuclease